MSISITKLKSLNTAGIKALPDPTAITYYGKPIKNLVNVDAVSPPPQPEPGPESIPTGKPSDLLGRLWTVMFPFNKQGAIDSPENLYIAKAEGDSRAKPYLYPAGGGVAFKCLAGGVHSSNSQYPRTELREMIDENWGKAAWSSSSGKHILELRQSVKHNLVAKPEVVVAQIHDGSDDVMQIKLEGGSVLKLVYDDGQTKKMLEPSYILGTPYRLKIETKGGSISVSYNDLQPYFIPKSGTGWYFKAGCYLQSNPSKGDYPNAWAEVTIYNLKVSHL